MKKIISFLAVLAVLVSCVSATALAGNGSGKNEPLKVESASVEEGGTILPGDGIKLVFSKNIANSAVKENNLGLFTLTDAEGNEMEAQVIIADDQVEPEKKNDVIIMPAEALPEGEYILTALSGITAKSGAVMEEDYVLSFTVSADAAPEEPAVEAPAGEVPEEAPAEEVPEEVPEEAPAEEAPAEKDGPGAGTVVLAVIAVLAVIVIIIIAVKKNKKK